MPESVHSEIADSQSTPAAPGSRRAALSSLSLAACGAALLFVKTPAQAALRYGDTQVLRFLEEVEELQTDFFVRAAFSSNADGLTSREREVLHTIAKQDREHAGWFAMARGRYGMSKYTGFYMPNASQSRPPRFFTFPVFLYSERGRMLEKAAEIKEISVGAYHGMALKAREPKLAQALMALAGVEGRHAAALHELSRADYRPAAMETALSARQVMDRLGDYGFRGEALR